ncbi:hypothetical protein E4V51_28350, partial [Paenibacillus sp. 28ISP30-2]|nr:hypothetical protein [Paenibacillus sp. 28ISP30-2]
VQFRYRNTEKIEKQFKNWNKKTFRLFELDNERIKQLDNILNNNYYTQLESKHQLVEGFKELLNIQEMSWIRADRINEE